MGQILNESTGATQWTMSGKYQVPHTQPKKAMLMASPCLCKTILKELRFAQLCSKNKHTLYLFSIFPCLKEGACIFFFVTEIVIVTVIMISAMFIF